MHYTKGRKFLLIVLLYLYVSYLEITISSENKYWTNARTIVRKLSIIFIDEHDEFMSVRITINYTFVLFFSLLFNIV